MNNNLSQESIVVKSADEEIKAVAEREAFAKLENPGNFPVVWPDSTRGCSNMILRSKLFGVSKKGTRQMLENAPLASWKGTTITYTGEELNQLDLDLWLEILHLSKRNGLGVDIFVSPKQLIESLGQTYGGSALKRLTANLQRLHNASVTIEFTHNKKNWVVKTHLLSAMGYSSKGDLFVNVTPRVGQLFIFNNWKKIELKDRRSLTSSLAQWLHGFFLTHATPHPMSVTLLQNLSGSVASQDCFRRQLDAAVQELRTLSWTIEFKPGVEEELLSVKHPQYAAPEKVPTLPAPVQKSEQKSQSETAKPRLPAWKVDAIAQARRQRSRVAL